MDTLWARIDAHVRNPVAFIASALTSWLLFALAARRWTRRFARGPLESLVHLVAVLVVRPDRPPRPEPSPSALA